MGSGNLDSQEAMVPSHGIEGQNLGRQEMPRGNIEAEITTLRGSLSENGVEDNCDSPLRYDLVLDVGHTVAVTPRESETLRSDFNAQL